ncbi:MAG: hypothetical protein QME83_11740 [Thermodesulfobacteriota bacterium]|nr:hypothetical protein [Thermodesulfobacteriota bacterium]
MKIKRTLPKLLEEIPLTNLNRIDVALEGDWSSTVLTVWTREERFLGFSGVATSHEIFRPSIELYFVDSWVGIHCFKRVDEKYVFDDQMALAIIDYIEAKLMNIGKNA